MIKFTPALIIATLACWAGQVHAMSGNEVLGHCQEAERSMDNRSADMDSLRVGLCIGLVEGVRSTLVIMGARDGLPQVGCVPRDVSNGQVVRVVLKYMRANPEKLHDDASMLVLLALLNSYPCKK